MSTGSAIGSNYGQRYKLTYKEKTLLLAAGAAGGIAGAFNAPIAGVLFALEVLLVDISITAFIPLLIAAASGTLVSKIILEENILLNFSLKQPFNSPAKASQAEIPAELGLVRDFQLVEILDADTAELLLTGTFVKLPEE